MAHTTLLEVKGLAKALVIHNGDLSGPVTVRWWAEGDAENQYDEVSLPHGILPAMLRAFLARLLPAAMERFIEAFVKGLEF